jgi:signal transduction histidine kinase/CheY-like chemotaxis protein
MHKYMTREWPYQYQEHRWLLGGVTVLFAIFVYFIYHEANTYLVSNLFVLGTITIVVIGWVITHFHAWMGIVVMMTGLLVVITLAIPWLPGSYPLLLIPTLLSLLFPGTFQKISITAMTAALVLYPATGTYLGLSDSALFAIFLLVGLIYIIGLIIEYSYGAIMRSLCNQYFTALTNLESARDHRQALNQANQNLIEAYAQLQRLNKLYHASVLEAEMARRAKEDFVSGVSHELRTPLNMIIGFSEMILNVPATYGTLPATLLSDMGVIHRNSKHLLQLINDVLDLSQIEAGQMLLRRSLVNVAEMVQEAIEAVMPLFRMKSLMLTASISDPSLHVLCDKLRIRQILLNLLSNAGRYTTKGGVCVRVNTSSFEVIFAVQDSGPGIAPEHQTRIFEPFQKGNSLLQTSDGSGLGLSISKRLVEAHGGRMWVESVLEQGSCFYFALPLQNEEPSRSAAHRWVNPYAHCEISPEGRKLPPIPSPKECILLVTKEEELRRHIESFFEEIDVISVDNIEDIEGEVEILQPSALLINELHVMDDPHFIRSRLGNLPNRLPVISCYLPSKREACDSLQVIDYLVKPITRMQLLNAIQNCLNIGIEIKTVLLVEDDFEMARLLRRQLTSVNRSYRTLHATTGQAALTLMRTRQPDLVLLDIGLTDINGYEVLAQKNRDPQIKHIPVVIISARDPLGEPIIADRLRVELRGGLSIRDVVRCTQAISEVFSPLQSKNQELQ